MAEARLTHTHLVVSSLQVDVYIHHHKTCYVYTLRINIVSNICAGIYITSYCRDVHVICPAIAGSYAYCFYIAALFPYCGSQSHYKDGK